MRHVHIFRIGVGSQLPLVIGKAEPRRRNRIQSFRILGQLGERARSIIILTAILPGEINLLIRELMVKDEAGVRGMLDRTLRSCLQLGLQNITDKSVTRGHLTPFIRIPSQNNDVAFLHAGQNIALRTAAEADHIIFCHRLCRKVRPFGSCNHSPRILIHFQIDIRILPDTVRRDIHGVSVLQNRIAPVIRRPGFCAVRKSEQKLSAAAFPEKSRIQIVLHGIIIYIHLIVLYQPLGLQNGVIHNQCRLLPGCKTKVGIQIHLIIGKGMPVIDKCRSSDNQYYNDTKNNSRENRTLSPPASLSRIRHNRPLAPQTDVFFTIYFRARRKDPAAHSSMPACSGAAAEIRSVTIGLILTC